ncbi:MAG TPA: hypothetical protein VM943_08815, partial [Pyrinomonadaceae bacterium]|nr:hypothetical protein [Pyrinomonadaceae bacterium]
MGFRAGMPKVARLLSLILLLVSIVFIGVSYYRLRGDKPFRLIQRQAQLSTTVAGIVEGYEWRVTKDNKPYILVRAARDVTYTDGRHELEDVYLEIHSEASGAP